MSKKMGFIYFAGLLAICSMIFFPSSAYAQATWSHIYGGGKDNFISSVKPTNDGGYIAAGWIYSNGAWQSDMWILKLDATGNVDWQKTYGGSGYDSANSIQQTSDGGYIVAGYANSFGAGGGDAWVLKLDANGAVVWQKAYGGLNSDWAVSIQQTNDGGYIVAGGTNSFGAGQSDIWILKLDTAGNVVWAKNIWQLKR